MICRGGSGREGNGTGELIVLLTTITDPHDAKADELADTYHQRMINLPDVALGLGVATNSGWVVIACVRALVERRTPPVVLPFARPLRG